VPKVYVIKLRAFSSLKHVSLTLPSPKERVLKMKAEVKVLSFGEDLGEANTARTRVFIVFLSIFSHLRGC
jgi:hypothetical protein